MIHYRGYKIEVLNDQYEVFQGQKLVATGILFDDPLARAKQIVDAEFVTPLLLVLRELKVAEDLATKEAQDAQANE